MTVDDRPAGPPDEGPIPEAAARRLRSSAWSSGLSVADFATCLQMGMDPVGFVQGYAVMQWSTWNMSTFAPYGSWGLNSPPGAGTFRESFRCPHGFVGADHRSWGLNYELAWAEQAWSDGWWSAASRMMEEAKALGAHGVIGVTDVRRPLAGTSAQEFSVRGTAVVVPGASPPPVPFSTFLSGQRLAKLVEAGFAPVSVVAAVSAVQMAAYCITVSQLSGRMATWGGPSQATEITQVTRAQSAARDLAREQARRQVHGDTLHGAELEVFENEVGEGDLSIQCVLRGNRVRRFKDFDPLPPPTPVVRLS